MKNLFIFLFFICLILNFSWTSAFCADANVLSAATKMKVGDSALQEAKKVSSPFEETKSETQHTITIEGKKIEYTATAGTLILKDEKENNKPLASIFYVAYTKNGADQSQRPVLFAFNGGPGSSSVWLHLGLLGPKRLEMPKGFQPASISSKLVDNEFSLLDVTDLVFIDPVGTGYSRAASSENPKQFYEVEADVKLIAHFMQVYLSKNERWGSPRFVLGESYGTTRAVALADYFDDRYFSALNGILLLSPVLRYDVFDHTNSNPILAYILALPSYTAAAFYHKKLNPEQFNNLEDALKASREFALGDYSTALLKGSSLSKEQNQKVVQRMAELTGLTEDYLKKAYLKVSSAEFTKQLLQEEMNVIGRMDTRYVGKDIYPLYNWNYFDPGLAFIAPAYSAAIYQYLNKDLNYQSEAVYEVLNLEVFPWKFNNCENRSYDVSASLLSIVRNYPLTKVHCCLGYYDLATPFLTTEFAIEQLNIPDILKENFSTSYYEAGHMIYNDYSQLKKQKLSLSQFIQSALKPIESR